MSEAPQLGKLVKPGQLYEIATDGTWRFFFDSSMIRTFRECPQMFKYRYVDNIRAKGRAFKTSVGSWWSSTMELYYNAFRNGDLDYAGAVEFALHEWKAHDMDSFKIDYPSSLEEFGGSLGAAEMVAEYFNWASVIDKRDWTVVSVEEGSGRNREILIGRLEYQGIKIEVYYIIKPDLYVIENGILMPVDHKTKDFLRSGMQHNFKPHFQTMGYIIAAQELAKEKFSSSTMPDRCLINVAARNKPGPKAKVQERFRRFPISYSVDQLSEWRRKVLHTALELRLCFERNEWPWSENACHNYSGCAYRPLDSVPEGARLQMIKSVYVQGKAWTPYLTEDELGEGLKPMPVTLVNLEQATPMDQMLIALVGVEKSGKSRLAATARKPVLVFDFDGRAASLAGRKGVYAVSFHDQTGYMQPDAFNTYLSIMTQLEQNNFDLGCVSIDGKSFGVEQGAIVQTIVLDSIARMSRAVMRYILKNSASNKGMSRQVKVGALEINFPGSFEAWNAEMIAIEDAILRTFASKKDTIAIFHESAEEDPASTAENPIFTGKVGIFPVRHARLLGYFNEVWRVQRGQAGASAQSAIPTIQTAPDFYFKYGASALDINTNEVPDIEKLIEIHRSKHGGSLAPAAQPPTPSVAPQLPKGPRMVTSGADIKQV